MVFNEKTGHKIDMIHLIFRPISKKQILQKLKAFGTFFIIIILEKSTFGKKKVSRPKY